MRQVLLPWLKNFSLVDKTGLREFESKILQEVREVFVKLRGKLESLTGVLI